MARTLGNEPIGNIVKLSFNGGLCDFIVIHHGKPSADYGSGFDGGTILLMKDAYTEHRPMNGGQFYGDSAGMHSLLNTSGFGLFGNEIKSEIRTVVIPHQTSQTPSGIKKGDAGLSVRLFLLSAREVAFEVDTYSGSGGSKNWCFSNEGTPLKYFADGGNRIANYGGSPANWLLRSTLTIYWDRVTSHDFPDKVLVTSVGWFTYLYNNNHVCTFRPAIVLPDTLYITDSSEVTRNIPPSTPPSITVSEPVKGGKAVTISWGASTDADGNLSGYRLERSVNNAAFQQIHDGNTLTFSDNITYGWQTVAYRVRAYDSAGAVSGYTTSRTYTVINNSAPTTPPWLNVPAEIKGGKPFEISWGASTDVDGNLAGYQLERSLNGGAYGQIYTGANQKYTDTVVKGTNTAAYRVRAYDTENAQSGYAISDTRTIINNTPPSISGENSQLGTKNEPFSISYSVSDPDGDTITVTEKLDNQVLRTFTAEAGKEYQVTLDADRFLQILNGAHTLTVTATDAPGESAVRTWTWTKNITHISIVKKVPKEPADGRCPYKCLLNLNSVIPTGALVTVEVCNNGFDQQPTWEECTTGARAGDVIFFSNRTKTANKWGVNFRVTINRSGASGDCYVTGVSGNFEEEKNA